MKAILFKKYNSTGDLELCEKEIPTPSPQQILVKVKNSSINAMEWHLMRGVWMARLKVGIFKPKKRYNVLGADISGEVVSIGSAIKLFKKGDQVFGDIFAGGLAEYAIAEEHQLAIKPAGVSHEQTAAIPVAGMTALKGVRDVAKIKKGDQVLINGASGGVGTFAIQMAKHYGAHVTAVCSKKNNEAVKTLGADAIINYDKDDFCATGKRYDAVLDIVGNRKPREIKRILKPNGICAVIGFTKFSTLFQFMLNPSKRIKMVSVEATNEVLNDLADMLSQGHVKSHVTAKYSLSEVPNAIRKTGSRHVCGKQIIENEK